MIGHRGAAAVAPENTLAGVRAARAAGADGVEFDVRPCRDGTAVVFHDRDLSRLLGRRDRVDALALDEVRGLRVRGEPIPTFDELLDEARDLLVNVEIKHEGLPAAGGFERAVAEALRRHGAARRALVSSFSPIVLARFRAAAPDVAIALLIEARTWRRFAWSARLLRPEAMNPETALVDARRLGRWRASGFAVFAWTIDDPAEARRLAALGVDGIITNDPARIGAAVRGA